MCPTSGTSTPGPPTARPAPMRLLLVGEVGEGGVRHTPQQCGVPEGLHQVGDEQAGSCAGLHGLERSKCHLEDILKL
ncbi:Uncharacterized protein FKW44_001838 [Caligus rogercresseyi]|uniref:Uncharacterized protein n=1 Tax=Caligus rogercresseyi TaxID=217165 RepID=A0A7T8QVV2_CALRO|nr:Uncharacterized protein FKW44_001838 [Caligus rogercresseyi]